MQSNSRCPITGVIVTLYNAPDGRAAYVYKTGVLGEVEWTDVAFMEAPAVLSLEDKYILAGVCRNNWLKGIQPTKINAASLRNLQQLDIPYRFTDRANLLLQHLYNVGGKEYKTVTIRTHGDSPLTYSSPEEFDRILEYLHDMMWVTWKEMILTKQMTIFQDVRITKEGIAQLEGKNQNTAPLTDLNKSIDEVEVGCRTMIVDILTKNTGKDNWEDLIFGDPKSAIRNKIKEHVESHPGASISDYVLLKDAIQFSDISHLKKTILNAHWPLFEPICKNKAEVERYFDDFAELRHPVKHNRDITEFVLSKGQTAMIWLKLVLDVYRKNANNQ